MMLMPAPLSGARPGDRAGAPVLLIPLGLRTELVHLRLQIVQGAAEAVHLLGGPLRAPDIDEVAHCIAGIDLGSIDPGEEVVDEVHRVVDDITQKPADRTGTLLAVQCSSLL